MEPIIGLMAMALGIWLVNWYKSGEKKPQAPQGAGLPLPPGADHIPVRKIRDIHPDGMTVDLPGGPSWAVDAVRFRMAGSRIPAGKSAAESWVLGRLREELSKAIGSARSITLSGLSRQADGTLAGTLWIDGQAVSAPVVDLPPEPAPVPVPAPARREPQTPANGHPVFPAGFPLPMGYAVPTGYGQPYHVPPTGYAQPVNGNGQAAPQGVQMVGYPIGGFRQ